MPHPPPPAVEHHPPAPQTSTSSGDTPLLLPLVAGLPELVEPVTEESEQSASTSTDETSNPSEEQEAVQVNPTRAARRSGINPSKLKTVRELHEQGVLEECEEEDEFYAFNEEINEKVVVWKGDITTLECDAIVNAANTSLMGGGGVDGAIHSAAGSSLARECRKLNGAKTGESKITSGHNLPAIHIIHTVGPIYSSHPKKTAEALLRKCYESTLELAMENGCTSIAFSGISTGIYGYPIDDATHVALDVTRKFLDTPEGAKLEKVIFTVFRPIDVQSYISIVPQYFPGPPLVENGEEESSIEEGEITSEADKVVGKAGELKITDVQEQEQEKKGEEKSR